MTCHSFNYFSIVGVRVRHHWWLFLRAAATWPLIDGFLLLGELTAQCILLQRNKSEQNQIIFKSPLAVNLPFLLQQLYPGWSNYIPQTSLVMDCSQSPFFRVRSSRRLLLPQYIWPPVPVNPRSCRSYEKNRGLWTVYVGRDDGNLAQRCLIKIPNCIIWTI